MDAVRPWGFVRYIRLWYVPVVILSLFLTACGGTTDRPSTPDTRMNVPPSGNTIDKVDDVFLRLLVVYQTQGIDAARKFASNEGLLTKQDEVRVTLGLDSDESSIVDGTALAVGRIGGRVTATHGNQIEIVVPVQTLVEYSKQSKKQSFFADLADFQHVKDITRTPVGQHDRATDNDPAARMAQQLAVGTSVSEGVRVTNAEQWQRAGITGKGVTIGVIDGGFTNYQTLIGTQNLSARSFRSDRLVEDATADDDTIHGTACAEIVHEMAPDATIILAAADTPGSFIDSVHWLVRTMHVDIITTSLGYYGAYPLDGSSDLAQAVDEAKAAGVFFVKSAGNYATAHYRSTYTDTDLDGYHDFAGGKTKNGMTITTRSGSVQMYLTWDDWKARKINYDLVLLDSTGREVGRSDIDQTRTGKRPAEQIVGEVAPGTYRVRVKKVNPDDANVPFDLLIRGAALELMTADGSISVPADARGAVAVAAINWRTTQVEDFSSHGPTTDGRAKPDIGAPDRVSSNAYKSVGTADFPGTSAAAPHMAGAAALFKQTMPNASPDAIRTFFTDHAKSVPGTMRGDNIVGAGLIDLGMPPTTTTTTTTMPTQRASATLVPSPTTSTSRILSRSGDTFADDFGSSASGLTPGGYQNGTYRLAADSSIFVAQTYPVNVTTTGATFEVQAQRSGGASDALMGVVVRRLDKDNYLLFAVTNDGGFDVLAKVNGSLHSLLGVVKPSSAIKKDTTNTLRVETAGNTFTFTVNGQVVSVVEVPDIWPNGGFGLAVGGGRTAGCEITFSAYRVTTR